MQHHIYNRLSTSSVRRLLGRASLLVSLTVFVNACSIDLNPDVDSMDPDIAAAHSSESTPGQVTGSALVNNRASENFAFSQFKDVNLTLNLSDYSEALSGDYFVLKIFQGENTYFLGVVEPDAVLALPLTMPAHLTALTLEMFTNSADGGTVVEELAL